MTSTLWDYLIVVIVYAALFGLLFATLYFLGWAFAWLIGVSVRLLASLIRRLRSPAERELENVRLKKDLAKINVCVLNAQESVLKQLCRVSAKRQR